MKQTTRWIFAFTTALIFCSSFFLQDGPKAASSAVLQTAAPAAPDAAWWVNDTKAGGISTPRYGGVGRVSRYITLRDGVRLALDIYLPQGLEAGTRLPTILEQTRYHRSLELRPELRDSLDKPSRKITEFVTRGYGYVVVDVRGTGASFGSRRMEFMPDEVRDGGEVVDWIIKQPWSDGKVGATGVSYVGTTAEMLLVNTHPAVKAIVPQFSLFDSYTDIVFPGGVPMTWFTKVWGQAVGNMDRSVFTEQARQRVVGVRPVDEDPDRRLLAEAIRAHAPNADVYTQVSAITFRDDRGPSGWTFDEISPHAYRAKLRKSGATIYSYSGWYDGAYQRAAIERFLTVRNRGGRLVLGPWTHGGAFYFSPSLGSRRSSFDHTSELLRFFDYHLKGIKTSIAGEAPVHYYTMGEDKWHSASTWPLPQTKVETWFFGSGNTLGRTRPKDRGDDAYKVDYSTVTGASSRWNTLIGGPAVIYPDRAAEDGKLLTYTSVPLEQDIEVTGHPVVSLFVSSTAADGQFFVYLEEVDEQGHVRYVTEGDLRAIHRKVSKARPPYKTFGPYRTYLRRDAWPLVPGRVAELSFDLLPTSILFRKGCRIRVAIAGADKDHFEPLPGDPPAVRVYRGGVYASRIDLPVIARK
ncbi:MAG: CocE/NonD family hydrolase [Pyrinomonadaceae bacterium]